MQFIETYWGLWLLSAVAFSALAYANQTSRVRRIMHYRVRRVMQHGGPDAIISGMI